MDLLTCSTLTQSSQRNLFQTQLADPLMLLWSLLVLRKLRKLFWDFPMLHPLTPSCSESSKWVIWWWFTSAEISFGFTAKWDLSGRKIAHTIGSCLALYSISEAMMEVFKEHWLPSVSGRGHCGGAVWLHTGRKSIYQKGRNKNLLSSHYFKILHFHLTWIRVMVVRRLLVPRHVPFAMSKVAGIGLVTFKCYPTTCGNVNTAGRLVLVTADELNIRSLV